MKGGDVAVSDTAACKARIQTSLTKKVTQDT